MRRELQGMRAVGVLAVFANHLFEWPRGGFVGVDVFFVLSGFFITGLLLREHTTDGNCRSRTSTCAAPSGSCRLPYWCSP